MLGIAGSEGELVVCDERTGSMRDAQDGYVGGLGII
jgi:hypothetical protein